MRVHVYENTCLHVYVHVCVCVHACSLINHLPHSHMCPPYPPTSAPTNRAETSHLAVVITTLSRGGPFFFALHWKELRRLGPPGAPGVARWGLRAAAEGTGDPTQA